MVSGKEIRIQISGIESTCKITRAMEKVAASKTRKAQDRMSDSRPYLEEIRRIVGHFCSTSIGQKHHYLVDRNYKRVGYIIVSSNRGLCGSLNISVFKEASKQIDKFVEMGVEVNICLAGAKALSYFKKYSDNVVATYGYSDDGPVLDDLSSTVKVMLDAYDIGHIDHLFLISNKFVNTMTQTPRVEQILPLREKNTKELKYSWDYIYEPEEADIVDGLLVRYIESQIYQAVVENMACEQAARMLAMKNATENAGKIIDELQLLYNKARQAAITQEISEIVGGAAAV